VTNSVMTGTTQDPYPLNASINHITMNGIDQWSVTNICWEKSLRFPPFVNDRVACSITPKCPPRRLLRSRRVSNDPSPLWRTLSAINSARLHLRLVDLSRTCYCFHLMIACALGCLPVWQSSNTVPRVG
jgi:hypothetical protein